MAHIHSKISNQREWFLHQISHNLVRDYGFIGLEDLNVSGMKKNYRLAKSISDASWSEFINLLSYKAEWCGSEIIFVDRFYPSSKTCSNCSWVKQDLELSDREWVCESCGTTHDRDVNASVNILNESLRISAQGVACA